MTDETLCTEAAKEIGSYGKNAVATAELSAASAMRLIGLLQFCSRHSGLSQDDHEFIRTMVYHLGKGFNAEHKAIAELIRRGWHSQFDKEFAA